MKKSIIRGLATGFGVVGAMAVLSVSAAPLGAGGTKMEIKQTSPGVVDLTFSKLAAVRLNEKFSGSKGSFTEKDETKKGMTATVVTYDADPKVFSGTQHCITGVGPEWAGGSGKKLDTAKLNCVPISGNTVTHRLEVMKSAVIGIVPLIVKGDERFAWGSHPFGPTRHYVTRPNGERDVITLLKSDANGNVSAAGSGDVSQYQKYYASIF